MAGRPKAAGPSSERVARNVLRIRLSRDGMTTAEEARRLDAAGQKIADTGITRIETGARRVDVDDLAALAVVLGCSPSRLLLPEAQGGTADLNARHHVTSNVTASTEEMWAWATGERPLGSPSPLAEAAFIRENRAHRTAPALNRVITVRDLEGYQAIKKTAYEAILAGASTIYARTAFEDAVTMALNELGSRARGVQEYRKPSPPVMMALNELGSRDGEQ